MTVLRKSFYIHWSAGRSPRVHEVNPGRDPSIIVGLNLAHFMEADQLEVSNDSQFVVKQIEDSYEARGEKTILYLKKVQELLKKFLRVQVKHVPRAENSRVDTLAKLAIASQ